MAYRRVLLMGDKLPETKTELENMFSGKPFKINYAGVKTKIIVSPVKNDTLVVDLNGEGADTVSKKVKDIGQKNKMKVTIKTEKPMSKVGESKMTKSALKEMIKEEIRNVLKEGFQGDEPEGDGLSGFRGDEPEGDGLSGFRGNINNSEEDKIFRKNRKDILKLGAEGARDFKRGIDLNYGPYKNQDSFEYMYWKKGWENEELTSLNKNK